MTDPHPYPWQPSPQHTERMRRFARSGVYLVTSESLSAGRTTLTIVEQALAAGIRLIQLREKTLAAGPLLALAHQVRALTARYDALLIINDRLDIALAAGADGVHLGQDDLPIPAARRLAPDLILGASTHSIEEAAQARREGASYINIGPIFPTRTKEWTAEFLGIEGLRQIAATTDLPFTIMGGIKQHHVPELRAAGARLIAVVTEITAAPDPAAAARTLLSAMA